MSCLVDLRRYSSTGELDSPGVVLQILPVYVNALSTGSPECNRSLAMCPTFSSTRGFRRSIYSGDTLFSSHLAYPLLCRSDYHWSEKLTPSISPSLLYKFCDVEGIAPWGLGAPRIYPRLKHR